MLYDDAFSSRARLEIGHANPAIGRPHGAGMETSILKGLLH